VFDVYGKVYIFEIKISTLHAVVYLRYRFIKYAHFSKRFGK